MIYGFLTPTSCIRTCGDGEVQKIDFILLCFVVLGTETRAQYMSDKHFIAGLDFYYRFLLLSNTSR